MKSNLEILMKNLREDGDDYALLNGYKFVLKVQPDDGMSINDFDCYGQVSLVNRWADGADRRPDGFTGAAEKLTTPYGDTYWWEPYREGHKVYNDAKERQLVLDILTYGYYVYTVEVYEECKVVNAQGETVDEIWHQVDASSLGGIEPILDRDTVADVVEQVLYDLTDYMENN